MRLGLMFAALALGVVAPANAAIVYSNNFNSENGGSTAPNFNGFTGLSVSGGTVDLIYQGAFGLQCAGGAGGCVDLDGSTGDAGVLASAASYSFAAGDTVTLSYAISGNQRGGAADLLVSRFDLSPATFLTNYGYSFGGPQVNLGSGGPTSFYNLTSNISSDVPFTTFTQYFTAGGAGTLTFSFYLVGSDDNVGPILDNVVLDITAVPEPASWAMMIGGFGAVGGAMRRRVVRVAVA